MKGIALCIGILMIARLFISFYSFDRNASAKDSPLYTDILDNDVYVKRGFDPAILLIDDVETLTDISVMQWENVVPHTYSDSYLVSDVLEAGESGKRQFLSFNDSPIQEYTFMIPFELNAQAIARLHGLDRKSVV